MHHSLTCSACWLTHDVNRLQNLCRECGKPLLAEYDLDALRVDFTPERVSRRSIRSMWRFHEVLPVDSPDEAVSLGEGQTPLLRAVRRGPFARFENLYIKDEAFNPTGSFKARGMSAAVKLLLPPWSLYFQQSVFERDRLKLREPRADNVSAVGHHLLHYLLPEFAIYVRHLFDPWGANGAHSFFIYILSNVNATQMTYTGYYRCGRQNIHPWRR